MWLEPRYLLLPVALLFVTAAQATPNTPSRVGDGVLAFSAAPKPHSSSAKDPARSGSRYGMGYEARHERDASERPERVERPERIERLERVERPERIERDDRGR